jgi:short-subunit dehydrogenase
MAKNVIIIGAGPGLSFGLSEKFGKEGYAVGLVSRNADKLHNAVDELSRGGIKAVYAIANAYKKDEIGKAISELKKRMGSINTLIYNAAAMKAKDIMEETADELVEDLKISAVNAFYSERLP